jgi:LAS superfamily LD-carboxypeptidase LdcB
VNEEYRAIQGAEWQLKQDEAEEKVKRVMAKEFPDFYRKKYIDPYEQGSELWDENETLLKEMQLSTERKITKESCLQSRAIW